MSYFEVESVTYRKLPTSEDYWQWRANIGFSPAHRIDQNNHITADSVPNDFLPEAFNPNTLKALTTCAADANAHLELNVADATIVTGQKKRVSLPIHIFFSIAAEDKKLAGPLFHSSIFAFLKITPKFASDEAKAHLLCQSVGMLFNSPEYRQEFTDTNIAVMRKWWPTEQRRKEGLTGRAFEGPLKAWHCDPGQHSRRTFYCFSDTPISELSVAFTNIFDTAYTPFLAAKQRQIISNFGKTTKAIQSGLGGCDFSDETIDPTYRKAYEHCGILM